MNIHIELKEAFEAFVKANSQDDYSGCAVRYLMRWANLMEQELDGGQTIAAIAEKSGYEADTEGITLAMHGMSVNILSKYWLYGEDLRQWHNNKYNVKGEGVVNPAMIRIKL